ncbi:MAG: C40 family peptidase [bacterium]|nr:C40 family peptidase [bacterium]
MKQLKRHILFRISVCLPTLLVLLCQGCSTQSLQKSGIPRGAQRSSFRFGAVRHTFADVFVEPNATSERLTQCMYGDVIRIERETEWWYSVKIGPYPELSGWMPKVFVTPLRSDALYLKERKITTIVIRRTQSKVFVWPSQTFPLAMGTELPFLGEAEQWYLVRLPTNDIGRIAKYAVQPAAPAEQQEQQPLIQVKAVLDAPEQPVKREFSDEPLPIVFAPQKIPVYRKDIISTAEQFLGKVYIWGGTTPRGFDCSGLIYFVYKLNGIELPRVSWLQYRNTFGKKIKKNFLIQGDLVFFETYKPGPSHVGIYIGNNKFIHASPKKGVSISNLDDPYFKRRYIGAKTVFSSRT